MTSTSHPREPRPARPWRLTLPLVLTLFTAAACSTDPDSTPATASPTASAAQPSTAPANPSSPARSTGTPTPINRPSPGTTPVKVTVGDQTFTAELYDNPTAHDLAAQLPLTLTMDDLNGLEKTGPLPRALTTHGAPRGSDPEPNEIGYYTPGHDLVLYYGDVGYYNGIIRIGRFDTAIDAIAGQPDGISVTVERA